MAILDAILNIIKRSMMPEWHQLDSSSTMPEQQESTKKKTLRSSSRSFWFSTGLYSCGGRIEKSVPRDHRLSSLGKPRDAKRRSLGHIFLSYRHTHDTCIFL